MRILLTILSVLTLSTIQASNIDLYQKLCEDGNTAYQNEEYDSAVALYSQVVNANYQSPSILYNLGNAHFKLNNLGPAIYYYELALKLNPTDADVLFNLQMANAQITDKLEEIPQPLLSQLYISISTIFSPNGWGIFALCLFVLALSLFSIYLLSNNLPVKQFSFFGAIGIFLLFAFSFLVGQMVKNDLLSRDKGIVFTSTLNVKSEPKLASADLFVIHEGTKVNVLEENLDWIRIALPDGNEGWVRSLDVKTF